MGDPAKLVRSHKCKRITKSPASQLLSNPNIYDNPIWVCPCKPTVDTPNRLDWSTVFQKTKIRHNSEFEERRKDYRLEAIEKNWLSWER